jgi:hypothetical protein
MRPNVCSKSAVLNVGRSLPVCPDQRTSTDLPGWSGSCHKRNSCAAISPCRPSNRVRRDGSLIAAVFFGLALCGPVISTASARRRWLLRAVQSRRNRGSAADSHPADSPAMAVPETLCHPFATAKIVVWPGTCSVRGGLIIAARSRDACGHATLCARGERTGNRCDRDKGNKCLLHSRLLICKVLMSEKGPDCVKT